MVLKILFVSLTWHYNQKLCGQGSFQLWSWKVNTDYLCPLNITDVIADIIAKEKLVCYICEVIMSCIHLWYSFNPHIQTVFTVLLCFVSHSRKFLQCMLISSQVVSFAFYFSSSVLQKKYQHRVLMFLLSQGKLFELLLILCASRCSMWSITVDIKWCS